MPIMENAVKQRVLFWCFCMLSKVKKMFKNRSIIFQLLFLMVCQLSVVYDFLN